MATPGDPVHLSPDEFKSMHRQLDALLTKIRAGCGHPDADVAGLQREVDAILKDLCTRAERDWNTAQAAVNTLVRTQVAAGLAARFMERTQPYKDAAALSALIEDGLLHRASFIRKSPSHLRFYRGLLAAMDPQPRSVLEIGVKGGGSTALWKALFPEATVVGLDIKLRAWLQSEPSADGVIYLQGDQADEVRLQEIADRYGPFDMVIDDGSHVTVHQAATIRALLPRVRSGGFYVIEDVHTSVKASSTRAVDYGDDIWAEFTTAVFQRLRGGPAPPASDGAALARELARWIAELVIARQVLAIRVKDRTEEA